MPKRSHHFIFFKLFYAMRTWITRRFTSAGLMVLGGLVISAVVGFETNKSMAYQIFALLFALLLVAMILRISFRGRFSIRRKLPLYGSVRQPLNYRVVIQNKTVQNQKGLSLVEDLEDPFPTYDEFVSTPEPRQKKRNIIDRKFGYHRWAWIFNQKRPGAFPKNPLFDLPPQAKAEVQLTFVPFRRGRLTLNRISITRADPLGLCKSIKTIFKKQTLLILPRRYRLPEFELPGSRKNHPGGLSYASSVGDSEEFLSLRDYRPGDPLRRIHWRSWAKTGKLIVKEYQDEFFVRHALVLDTFQKSAYSDVFEEAISVAASFVSEIRTNESLLDLMFIGPQAYCFTSGRNVGHADQMLKILASVRPCTNKPFEQLAAMVVERAPLLSGCICVLLAWDNPRREFIKNLRALNIPTLIFIITDAFTRPVSLDPDSGPGAENNVCVLKAGQIEEGIANGCQHHAY